MIGGSRLKPAPREDDAAWVRRVLLLLAGLAVLAGCGGAPALVAPQADVDGCAGSHLRPEPANVAQVRAATLCLLNARRARTGAAPLTENLQLQAAAERHSLDMARRNFFEHRNPDGVEPPARIVQAGYPPIFVGENLAWGEEQESTPAQIVALWMTSRGHRENLLDPRYREIGIGLAYDAPEPADPGIHAAVYTTTFGAGGRR